MCIDSNVPIAFFGNFLNNVLRVPGIRAVILRLNINTNNLAYFFKTEFYFQLINFHVVIVGNIFPSSPFYYIFSKPSEINTTLLVKSISNRKFNLNMFFLFIKSENIQHTWNLILYWKFWIDTWWEFCIWVDKLIQLFLKMKTKQ